MKLAKVLTHARTQSGLSQDELAKRTGLSVDAIRKLERRITLNPGFFTVVDIAGVVKASLTKIYRDTR